MSTQLRFTLAALILGLLLGLGLPLLALAAADAPVLSFRPAQAELLKGQTLTAEVWLENAPAIYGFEVHITFDPAVLEVVDADPAAPGIQVLPGDFISPSQPSFTIQNQADNVTGTLDYAITLLNPAPPVEGTGRLFNIAFRALAGGTAAVSITDKSLLGTRAGGTIAPIRQNLQVTIRQLRFRVFMPNIMRP
jgi:hypothetical protein